MKNILVCMLLTLPNMIYGFSNGTLLPHYLCGVPNDGYPKSLGGVLSFFESEEKKLVIANIHQQNSTIPQKNLITVNKTSGNNYYIIPSEIIDITLVSKSGLPIVGAMIYAEDNKMNRVGKFLTFGANMQPFSACGPNNVGIIHNKELSEDMYYYGIKWQAPSFLLNGCNKIIFKGLAVTDSGFGFHETEYLFVK